jgi:uncharacterized protein (TIGR03000 family)
MFEKMLSYGGGLLIVSIAILVAPSVSLAQHGGGHGGGGFGGGGFHGGAGFGGARFGGGHFGGARFGGSEFRTYRPNYGIYGYPYYGAYGYDPYYYDAYPYTSVSPTYDSDYNGPYTAAMPNEADNSAAAAPPSSPDNTAHVTVSVPADARIFVDGTPMTSTGPVRQFHSPPLAPGRQYTYNFEARWNDDGREITQKQKVDVSAGAHPNVTFQSPREGAPQVSNTLTEPAKPPVR